MKHFLFVLFAVLLWACSSSEDTPVTPKIDITSPELPQALPDNGSTASINFTANGAWTVQAEQEWCSVSPLQGEAGNHTLQISASANTDYDERNTKVVITCGTIKKEITITQKQKDAILLTSSKVEINAEGGEISIELESNVQYSYEIAEKDQEWIKPNTNATTRGLTTSTLRFTANENTGTDKREGHITISYGELSEEVTIYQEGMTPNIVLTRNEYTISDAGENILIELKSNVDYQMELPAVNWISETKTRGMSSYSHRITIAPNEGYDPREAYITFTNSENGVSEQVHIMQVQKDAIIVARNEYTLDYQASTLNFEVSTNVELSVESSATWIKQVKTRGLHTETLNFTIEENESEETREGVITVKNGEVKQEIKVSQTPKPIFEIAQKEFIVESTGKTIEVEIKSNIDYQIQMPKDVNWITQTETLSATAHTIRFIIAANTSYDSREAEIVFYNSNQNLTQRVNITQMQKDAIVVAQNEYIIGSKGGELNINVSANIELTTASSVDWISTVTTRGLQPKELKFKVAENTTSDIRQGIITVSSGDLKQEIKITQEEKGNDRDILINLYNATNGEHWLHNDNWCSDKPLNEWYGVTTDKDGKVTELIFTGNYYELSNKLEGAASFNGLKKLKRLYCDGNSLSSIDVSGCPALTNLSCGNKELTALKLSANLEELTCNNAEITSLDLSLCTKLRTLSLGENQISVIDLSSCTLLENLSCSGKALQNIKFANSCVALTYVDINRTSIKEIDLSDIKTLGSVSVINNDDLTKLKVSGCNNLFYFVCEQNKLQALDVSGLTKLNELQCWSNELTSLNVTGCTALERLWFQYNKISNIDISSCTKLDHINCEENNLTSLDAHNLKNLKAITCKKNQLTSLNVSGCTSMQVIQCDSNKLETLDLSNLTNLESVSCTYNNMTSLITLNTTGKYNALNCSNNLLTSLDATGFSTIDCSYNNLSNLKVGASLFMLWCSHNQLDKIDFSTCTRIAELDCSYNKLKSLDVTATKHGFDGGINCSYNELTSVYLNGTFGFQSAGNRIETISLSQAQFNENIFLEYFKFESWGEHNQNIYKTPTYRNGYQYPKFIFTE